MVSTQVKGNTQNSKHKFVKLQASGYRIQIKLKQSKTLLGPQRTASALSPRPSPSSIERFPKALFAIGTLFNPLGLMTKTSLQQKAQQEKKNNSQR